MAIVIRNLDAPVGAELHGIDLAEPLLHPDLRAMKCAWQTRLVIIAREQRLSDPQLLAFSRQFGALDPPGPNPYGEPFNKQFPEINVISNVIENGKPIGNLGAGEAVWHADMTYVDVPPKAAVLYALESSQERRRQYLFCRHVRCVRRLANGSQAKNRRQDCGPRRVTQ